MVQLSTRILVVGITLINVASSDEIFCDTCTDRANTTILKNISIRYYPSNYTEGYTSALASDAATLAGEIHPCKPTVIYIHGWIESPENTSVQTVINAYATRDDHNVLIMDYSGAALNTYLYFYMSFESVCYVMSNIVQLLVDSGLDSRTLHIVSHSTGVQLAGCIGRTVNFIMPRITGLDGACPRFPEAGTQRLRPDDAAFVDVIHTDNDFFGIYYPAGHTDFFPGRGAAPQPGCEGSSNSVASRLASCSHTRSWHYWAESLLDETAFVGLACQSYLNFDENSCSSNATAVMGYATPYTTRGIFTLQINSASPYGRGISGATYEA